MTLHVAPTLALPDEFVTQKAAILAMSGAGKSNTAVVLAEELYTAGLPWVAIDPKGDWYGIRAGRDGADAKLRTLGLVDGWAADRDFWEAITGMA